jgi:hypothetical protein
MRVIREEDTQVFTDPTGDTLTLLVAVRQKDSEGSDELEQQEAFDALKMIGLTLEDAIKQRDTRGEEMEEAAKGAADAPKSAKVRRFRFLALARQATTGGQTVVRSALAECYDRMDRESVAWVDAQVASIWERAIPGEAEKNRPGTDVGRSFYPVSSTPEPLSPAPANYPDALAVQPLSIAGMPTPSGRTG